MLFFFITDCKLMLSNSQMSRSLSEIWILYAWITFAVRFFRHRRWLRATAYVCTLYTSSVRFLVRAFGSKNQFWNFVKPNSGNKKIKHSLESQNQKKSKAVFRWRKHRDGGKHLAIDSLDNASSNSAWQSAFCIVLETALQSSVVISWKYLVYQTLIMTFFTC